MITIARPNVPTIPDDKVRFFEKQLYRELSHMFEWKNLPQTIPADYLESNLIRHGRLLCYYDEEIGLDILRAQVTGYNRHDKPTHANTYTNTTNEEVRPTITRTIRYLSDNMDSENTFNELTDGVLINNTEHGESARHIVEHYAKRLAIVQSAFDTNILWQNMPYIFLADGEDTRLSLERFISKLYTGKPHIHVDKSLFHKIDGKFEIGQNIEVPYIANDLIDTQNEIMMKFRQSVGIDTAGVDKKERTNTLEIMSNTQHTKTVLNIMLEQREIACEAINTFFGENISVKVVGVDEEDQEGGEHHSTDNSGTQTPSQDE